MKRFFLLAFLLALPLHAEEPKAVVIKGPTPVEVEAAPYVLKNIHGDALKPGDNKGSFRFDTALKLTTDTYRFGGFSALSVADDTLYALTDEGYMLKGKLKHDKEGVLIGLKDSIMAPLWPENRPPEKKLDYDAEAMVWLKKGAEFMVSFEHQHRLVHYDLGKAPFIFRTRNVPEEVAKELPDNSGLEAIVQLDKESYLVFSEASRDPAGNIRGWIVKGDQWELLNIQPTEKFMPTDMAMLPNGNILLLERSYTYLSGVKSRISLLKKADIKPGAVLVPSPLALFDAGSGADNMEGIAVLPKAKDGSVGVLLISDDNFNPLQNTILIALNLAKDRF